MRLTGYLFIFIISISINSYANDAIINEIDSFIIGGQNNAAAELIESYIKNNPASEIVPELIDKYISSQLEIQRVISGLKEFELIVSDKTNKFHILKSIAVIEELYGSIDDAQKYFHNAALIAESGEQAFCYFESARLLYETGDINMAIIELSSVFLISTNSEITSRSLVLKGHLVKSAGDYSEAEKLYNHVADNYPGTYAELEAVFSLINLYFYIYNDRETASNFLEQLKLIAPRSPEYEIAYNMFYNNTTTNISIAVTPQRFLEYYKNNQDTSRVTLEQGDTNDITVQSQNEIEEEIFVQTGSFIIKENAEYMILDLADAGFNAQIMSLFINDTLYYKVVIGGFKTNTEANSVLIRVRESGFQGFLLFR